MIEHLIGEKNLQINIHTLLATIQQTQMQRITHELIFGTRQTQQHMFLVLYLLSMHGHCCRSGTIGNFCKKRANFRGELIQKIAVQQVIFVIFIQRGKHMEYILRIYISMLEKTVKVSLIAHRTAHDLNYFGENAQLGVTYAQLENTLI